MKKHLKSVIALTAICAVIAVLLSVSNFITAPIIEKNESASVNDALKEVLPDGEDFVTQDISDKELPSTVTEVYSEKNGGYVFKLSTTGYSTGLVILCGVDKDGTVTGTVCIASNETLGYEKTYGENVLGATLETVDNAPIISGATKTTEAYRNAVKDALNAFVIMNGGSVDLRDEEQILNDNLSAALPEANGEFSSVFITEVLEKTSAVYSAKNGTGFVFVCGEKFVACDAGGNILNEVSDDLLALLSADIGKILSSKLNEIDITSFENMPSQVQKAYKTDSGNYVFDLRAAGFGINGDQWYKPSGEYIYIRASVSSQGQIIACETVFQKETEGIGSACGELEFYNQFIGKDKNNYQGIDAISGATITTNGYKTAISKVFEAVEILKGEP